MPIILASQSPRRKELMKQITSDFVCCPANINEDCREHLMPEDYVMLMAQKKAQQIYKEYPNQLVIGCDTIVTLHDEIFGKPKDKAEAYNMLQKLSGQTHTVHTGIYMMNHHQIEQKIVSAQVTFFSLTPDEMKEYLETKEYTDKAGGYGIQGKGAFLVKEISGDFYSIVGFPVAQIKRMIEKF